MAWSVYLETRMKAASAELCHKLEWEFHPDFGAAVGNPRGYLAVTLEVEAPNAAQAVQAASHVVQTIFLYAGVEAPAQYVEVMPADERGEQPTDFSLPPLATVPALAKRAGISVPWVRNLLGRKGAPDPVPIEGAQRATVYVTPVAMTYLRQHPEE